MVAPTGAQSPKTAGSKTPHILVVDDDRDCCELVAEMLALEGYNISATTDGLEASSLICTRRFDLVLTDIKVPCFSGMELLSQIRSISPRTQVILMTGFASIETAVTGLKGGAFDYLTKPLDLDQVRASVAKALNLASVVSQHPSQIIIQHRDLTIDLASRRLWRGNAEVRLTRLEFDVLAYLFRAWGRSVPPAELLDKVWGYHQQPERSSIVKSCIRRLRDKLTDDPAAPRYIQNVRGIGYRLTVEESQAEP